MHRLIVVGTVVKPHGLDGAVLVRTESGKQSCLDYVDVVLLGQNSASTKEFTITETAWMPKGWKVNLEGISRIEEAEPLVGLQLFVSRDQLEQTSDDEFYITDLEGMPAVDESGKVVGKFLYAAESPTGPKTADLWWFEIDGKEVALPAVRKHIVKVDIENRRIVIAHWAI